MQPASDDRRQLIAEWTLTLLLIVLVEVVVRIQLGRMTPRPVPTLLPGPVTNAKYVAYRDQADERPLDVLVMGASPMLRVDPLQLGPALAVDGTGPASAFNLSAPAHWVELDRRLLDGVVLPLRKPRVIVYGILPLHLLIEQTPEETESWLAAAPIHRAYARTPAARLYGALLQHLVLLEYRTPIVERLVLRRPPEDDYWNTLARTTDAVGNIRETGWETAAWKVDFLWPTEELYQQQLRDFDGLMRRTHLFRHLKALADLCRARGIRLVVLNHAVHPKFLELLPHGQRDQRRFVRRLRATVRAAHVAYFDPTGDGMGRREWFRDTHHLNEVGGVWLTDEIARFVKAQLDGERMEGDRRPDAGGRAP